MPRLNRTMLTVCALALASTCFIGVSTVHADQYGYFGYQGHRSYCAPQPVHRYTYRYQPSHRSYHRYSPSRHAIRRHVHYRVPRHYRRYGYRYCY